MTDLSKTYLVHCGITDRLRHMNKYAWNWRVKQNERNTREKNLEKEKQRWIEKRNQGKRERKKGRKEGRRNEGRKERK